MTPAQILARALVLTAIALGVAVWRREREHWPIPVALAAALVVDVGRDHGAAWLTTHPLDAMAWSLTPAIAAWAALTVFQAPRWAAAVVPVLGWAAASWWYAGPMPVRAVSILVQAVALGVYVARGGRLGVTQRCACWLLAGDLAGLWALQLLGEHGPALWWVEWVQAGGVAVALVVVQWRWIRRT